MLPPRCSRRDAKTRALKQGMMQAPNWAGSATFAPTAAAEAV